MYIVVVEDERGALVVEHALTGGALTLGRDADNDIVLPSISCSRHHASITVSDHDVYITDTDSSNGVFLDDQRIKAPAPLTIHNIIRIGEYRIFLERTAKRGFDTAIHTTILNPNKAHAKLVITSGAHAGHELLLFDPICCIGRTDENDITLPDASVSRHHARLKLQDNGSYLLSDLASFNGSWVNGKRLKKLGTRVIWHGDTLQFGNVECLLLDRDGLATKRPASKQWIWITLGVIAAAALGAILSLLLKI